MPNNEQSSDKRQQRKHTQTNTEPHTHTHSYETPNNGLCAVILFRGFSYFLDRFSIFLTAVQS